MSLTMLQAATELLAQRPEGTEIKGALEQDGKYLFLAPWPDPMEGRMLPFFSVDKETGDLTDFHPFDYDNSAEIVSQLLGT